VTGGAAVGAQGEEQRGKNAALRGTSADGPGVRDVFPQPHLLLPVICESFWVRLFKMDSMYPK